MSLFFSKVNSNYSSAHSSDYNPSTSVSSSENMSVEISSPAEDVQSETTYSRVSSYFQSWKDWMFPNSYQRVSVENSPTIDFDARKKQLEAIRKKGAEIRDNTLFWRVTGEDLGLKNPEEKKKSYDFILGITDGEFKYTVSSENLRTAPASTKTQIATALGLVAASGASYYAFGEGIVTKGLMTSLFSFVLPKLEQIPYVPPIVGPALGTGAVFLINQLTDDNFYLKFAFVTGIGLCAMIYKRGGKGLATAGWSGIKKYIIPLGCTEAGMRSIPSRVYNWCKGTASNNEHVEHSKKHCVVAKISLEPIHSDSRLSIPAAIEFTTFDGDMYYSLVLGEGENEKKFPPTKMASKDDDDEEDEEGKKKKVKNKKNKNEIAISSLNVSESQNKISSQDMENGKDEIVLELPIKEKKKKKKEKKSNTNPIEQEKSSEKVKKKEKKKKEKDASSLTQKVKEGSLFVISGVATGVSKYYLGEGITTGAINTIFSASVKAKCRLMPIANSYGILTLASGTMMLVKILKPDSFVGGLSFMPISILTSMGTKDIKDRIVTGKEPKNTDLYEVPVTIQKIGNKIFGWTPEPIKENANPFEIVLDENNNGQVEIKFNAQKVSPENPDKEIEAVLKIAGKKLKGSYKLTKQEKQELHLSRIKAKKLGAGPEAAFMVTSVAATLLASYLTRIYQQESFTGDPTTINAEKLGEGIVTNILNSVLATYLKQFGKKLPPVPRDGGLLFTAVGAIALERYLMATGNLPMLFSSIPTSGFMAIQAKKAKQWVYEKPYGKTEGWITKNWPTNDNIHQGWESLKKTAKKVFCCKQEELTSKLEKQDDSNLLLIQRKKDGNMEVIVMEQKEEDMGLNPPQDLDKGLEGTSLDTEKK